MHPFPIVIYRKALSENPDTKVSTYRALYDFSDPCRKTKIGIRRKHTSFFELSQICRRHVGDMCICCQFLADIACRSDTERAPTSVLSVKNCRHHHKTMPPKKTKRLAGARATATVTRSSLYIYIKCLNTFNSGYGS